jgi:hypothetical protein
MFEYAFRYVSCAGKKACQEVPVVSTKGLQSADHELRELYDERCLSRYNSQPSQVKYSL